jgi:ribonucleotide reductase alpha subunit
MLYKDAANAKSNQKNLGTIRSSNLCTEIIEYTSQDEVAVCNLGSIALNMCVQAKGTASRSFSFESLERATRILTRNLNRVIDISHYPVEQARYSNKKNRPIGIGV